MNRKITISETLIDYLCKLDDLNLDANGDGPKAFKAFINNLKRKRSIYGEAFSKAKR